MVDRDELRELATGTLPAPARVVALEADCTEAGLDAPAESLLGAAQAGCRVTLRICGLAPDARISSLLEALGARLGREGLGLAPEALALPAAAAHPEELALDAAGACAGSPPMYLLLPASGLEAVQRRRALGLPGGPDADARRWWSALLALAAAAPAVSLVPELPGPGVSVLAPGQRWLGPSPGTGELIPAAPCRLRLTLDFATLVAATGDRPLALARLAGRIVTAADELLDTLLGVDGPRRLSLQLDGVARAVLRSGRHPRSYAALGWARSRLAAFRDGACAASIRLACARGAGGGLQPFPLPGALEVAEARALDRAVLVHGARHSHLVCLSPWSLAPPETGRDGLALLPALSCADSIAWRRPAGEEPNGHYDEVLRFSWAVALAS
jgi:hypothetical protein